MTADEYFDSVREMVTFIYDAPCCGEPSVNYAARCEPRHHRVPLRRDVGRVDRPANLVRRQAREADDLDMSLWVDVDDKSAGLRGY